MPAGRVVVDAAGHHHDVVGDRGQRYELLHSADLETVPRRTDFGLDDLQVGSAGLLGRGDAQHRLTVDRLFADRLEMLGFAEPAQDRDRRVVQADTDADARRSEVAETEREFVEFGDVGMLTASGSPLCCGRRRGTRGVRSACAETVRTLRLRRSNRPRSGRTRRPGELGSRRCPRYVRRWVRSYPRGLQISFDVQAPQFARTGARQ